jgi:ACDE family multidrug resistance protein
VRPLASPLPDGSGRRPGGDGRRLIFSVTVVGVTANPLLAPTLPELVADLSAPAWVAGAVLAIAALPSVVLAPVLGHLSDRLGRAQVLAASLALFGLAGLACALAPTWQALLAARLVQGVGAAGPVALAIAMVGDRYDEPDRTRMLGRNAAVLTGTLAVLPPAAGVIAQSGTWRTPLWLFGSAILLAPAVLRNGNATHLPPELQTRATERTVPSRGLAADRVYVRSLIVTTAVFAILFGLTQVLVPVVAASRFSAPVWLRGLLIGVPALVTAMTSWQAGRLANRATRSQIIRTACLLLTVGAGVLVISRSLWVLLAGVLVAGVAEGLAVPQLQRIAAGTGTSDQRGMAVSLFLSSARLGQAVGPVAAAASFQAFGGGPSLTALTLASLGLWLVVRSRQPEG